MGGGGDTNISHTGRGGAGTSTMSLPVRIKLQSLSFSVLQTRLTPPPGNIQPKSKSPTIQPSDLSTPTLKNSTYTTGRGGSGNMARNDPANPEKARAAQDVEAPAVALQRRLSNEGSFHTGRGGAANVVKKDELEGRSKSKERKEGGLVDKGKEILGLKK
jgi:hypothetical protein